MRPPTPTRSHTAFQARTAWLPSPPSTPSSVPSAPSAVAPLSFPPLISDGRNDCWANSLVHVLGHVHPLKDSLPSFGFPPKSDATTPTHEHATKDDVFKCFPCVLGTLLRVASEWTESSQPAPAREGVDVSTLREQCAAHMRRELLKHSECGRWQIRGKEVDHVADVDVAPYSPWLQ